jgi:hypothetical protein
MRRKGRPNENKHNPRASSQHNGRLPANNHQRLPNVQLTKDRLHHASPVVNSHQPHHHNALSES